MYCIKMRKSITSLEINETEKNNNRHAVIMT